MTIDDDKLNNLADSVRKYRKSREASHMTSLREHLVRAPGQLNSLVDNLSRINRLSQILHDVLSPPLNDHVRVANMNKGALTLAVDNNSLAAKLRFEKAELMSHLRKNGFPGLTGINVQVNPEDKLR